MEKIFLAAGLVFCLSLPPGWAQANDYPLGTPRSVIETAYTAAAGYKLVDKKAQTYSARWFATVEESLFGPGSRKLSPPALLVGQTVETLTWTVTRSGSADQMTVTHQFFQGKTIYSLWAYKNFDNFQNLRQDLRNSYPRMKVEADWAGQLRGSLPDGTILVLENRSQRRLVNPADPASGFEEGTPATRLELTSPTVKAIQNALRDWKAQLRRAVLEDIADN